MNDQTLPTHFNSFAEFYPYYLSEHQNRTCRRLHLIGSLLVLALLFGSITRAIASPRLESWAVPMPPLLITTGYTFWVGTRWMSSVRWRTPHLELVAAVSQAQHSGF